MDNKPEEVKVEQPAVTNQENSHISPENEINWQKFREQRAEERRVRLEMEAKAKRDAEEKEALRKALEEVVQHKNAEPVSQEDEDEFDRKFKAKWSEHERKLEERRHKEEEAQMPQRIRQSYPDFDKICTDENIDYLQYKYPEVYRAFKNAPDSVEKWGDVYSVIKRLIPNPDSTKDLKKAEKNFIKPQSMNVGGVTQTGDTAPMMLNEQKKADNWKRMQSRMKGTG